jgi:hypothetical protein
MPVRETRKRGHNGTPLRIIIPGHGYWFLLKEVNERMKIAFVIPMNGSYGEKSFYDYAFYSTFLLPENTSHIFSLSLP